MPQLLVRKLRPTVVAALKARAAKHGRSTEAEHREILERALLASPPGVDFKAFLRTPTFSPGLRVTRSRDHGRFVDL